MAKLWDQGDYAIRNHGSIVTIWPLTDECREWLRENTDGQWIGGGTIAQLACEPRYVGALCEGMADAGFSMDNNR
jgi:hypothetical protein